MSRAFCIPGIIFLAIAFILSFLVSISLPYLTALDITRAHFGSSSAETGGTSISQVRLGIWSYCFYQTNGDKTCSPTGHAYSLPLGVRNGSGVIIGSSWTRGLAVHPVATAITFIALGLSFSTHITVTLIASIISFLAAVLTLIAFAIDIALYVYLKHEVGLLSGANGSTNTGPAFWMTFASLILLLLAGCTVCFGRRRDRMSGATTSYPMKTTRRRPFWQRFRR